MTRTTCVATHQPVSRILRQATRLCRSGNPRRCRQAPPCSTRPLTKPSVPSSTPKGRTATLSPRTPLSPCAPGGLGCNWDRRSRTVWSPSPAAVSLYATSRVPGRRAPRTLALLSGGLPAPSLKDLIDSLPALHPVPAGGWRAGVPAGRQNLPRPAIRGSISPGPCRTVSA